MCRSQRATGCSPNCSSRGAAFDDLDNDGDIDVVVLNSRERADDPPQHDTADGQPLAADRDSAGGTANRDGVGHRVRVVAGDLTQIDEVHSGRGYQSHFGTRLHFGLAAHDRVDRIEVRWLGGAAESWKTYPPTVT